MEKVARHAPLEQAREALGGGVVTEDDDLGAGVQDALEVGLDRAIPQVAVGDDERGPAGLAKSDDTGTCASSNHMRIERQPQPQANTHTRWSSCQGFCSAPEFPLIGHSEPYRHRSQQKLGSRNRSPYEHPSDCPALAANRS